MEVSRCHQDFELVGTEHVPERPRPLDDPQRVAPAGLERRKQLRRGPLCPAQLRLSSTRHTLDHGSNFLYRIKRRARAARPPVLQRESGMWLPPHRAQAPGYGWDAAMI
jgi:hypothetical protein